MTVAQQQSRPQELVPPPRQVTARGARRAWGDRRVKFWWVCAVAIAVIAAMIAGERVWATLRERDLIRNGAAVTATVIGMQRSMRVGYTLPRTDSLDVKLKAQLPDGREVLLEGTLPRDSGVVRIGMPLEIRLDPLNPTRWTDRTEMLDWGTELIIPISLVPLILVLLGTAIWQRQRVLNVWRHGSPVQGIVHELKHTAMAPLSRLVRYSIAGPDGKRIFSTFIPSSAGIPAVGETIHLLALSDRADRTVVTKLYE